MLSEKLIFPLTPVPVFPPLRERAAWRAMSEIPRNRRFLENRILPLAQNALTAPIPELPASLFMEFVRIGDRKHYEKPYFQRRQMLEALVLAEGYEYRGRFIDRIIDYLWAIMGEYTWSLPAHVNSGGDPLPELPFEMVDLFCAETGMLLAQTLNFMESELRDVSLNLVSGIRRNLQKRIIEPCEREPFPFWWGHGFNNWSPWCASNVLGVALTVLSGQPERQEKMVRSLAAIIDRYLDLYPADGGCDEGPSYWGVSPASMLIFLEELYNASGGKISIYDEPLVRHMGEFFADCYLDGGCFTPFSDAAVRFDPPVPLCRRYGERTGSEKLKNFTLRMLAGLNGEPYQPYTGYTSTSSLFRMPAFLFWLPAEEVPAPPAADSVSYYPVVQQLFVHAGKLAFAAKGGHNAENHNHNDLGQFMFFHSGEPMIVDLGRCEYTRHTFSERRYENWVLNALGHNPPLFDGVGQHDGKEYRAADVRFSQEGNRVQLEMELAGAFPAELELVSVRRSIRLDTGSGEIQVEDRWESRRPHAVQWNLYTPAKVAVRPGETEFRNGSAVMRLTLAGTPVSVAAAVPENPDPELTHSWGAPPCRVRLTAEAGCSGAVTMRFTFPASRN